MCWSGDEWRYSKSGPHDVRSLVLLYCPNRRSYRTTSVEKISSSAQHGSCSSSHYYKDDDPPLSFHEINSPIIIIPAQIICVGNVFRGKSEFRPSRDCFINGVASSLLCWSTFFVYQEKIYRKSGTQQLTQGLKCIFCNEKLSI